MNGGESSKPFPIENGMKRIYHSNNLSIKVFVKSFVFVLFNPLLEEVCDTRMCGRDEMKEKDGRAKMES